MKFTTGISFVVVCFWCSGIADGNPYVTKWWSRGVATVKNFVLGFPPTPWHREAAWRFEFDPDAGLRKAPDYQRHFGHRGERLIELLGSGAYRPGNGQSFSRT
ncbi:uncharacterized protein LOC125500615 [Athalia rosae]|uniref:uncharacterized protein LOC125500615 n=1 Tax=Athalia rosae TaxID=37344 RepID=UPI00203328DA|nr:uncharacterized protein LOC125500615 [Athalia rosae]